MPAKIRVAIIGVGNCASSLVQALAYYGSSRSDVSCLGVLNSAPGGYSIKDIEISAAFDVHADKVGADLADAIFLPPNNTIKFCSVSPINVPVLRGKTIDGIGPELKAIVPESPEPEADVAEVLKRTSTDVVVLYLPVGSQLATEFYAEQALTAGCAVVNCIPVFLASDPLWQARFERRCLPIIGDDIKSQVGATIVHRVLANLLVERGVQVDRTYQLNFGGNADFLNMLDRERLASKRRSKTQSVTSQLDATTQPENVYIGPSDYVGWLHDRKVAHIRLEGSGFGGVPLSLEVKLEVWDSPNSAGVVVDAIRCAKIAMDRGQGGALIGPSSYLMKSPPQQYSDYEARAAIMRFISEGLEVSE